MQWLSDTFVDKPVKVLLLVAICHQCAQAAHEASSAQAFLSNKPSSLEAEAFDGWILTFTVLSLLFQNMNFFLVGQSL